MKKVIVYLLFILILITGLLIVVNSNFLLDELSKFLQIFNCCLIGGLGGVLYGLRAVYLNYSVKKNWTIEWEVWYYIRPLTSIISGGISYLVIKAGLLVLEANLNQDSSYFGVYIFAFIAGLNVDRFISKIEDLANTTWGIEKSRTSLDSDRQLKK